MQKIFRNFAHHTLVQDITIIFFISLFPLIWLQGNQILLGHDIGFPVEPIGWFLDRIWTWSEKISSFGSDQSLVGGILMIHGLEAFFSFIGFSVFTVQKLTLIFWNLSMSLSMYFFLQNFFPEKEYRWFKIFASLLYIINFFILSRYTVFERTGFSMQVAIPLSLGILFQYLEGKKSFWKTAALLSLTFFVFNAGGIAPFVGILFFVIFFFLLWNFFFTLRNKKGLVRTILAMLLAIVTFSLVNLYWILPMMYTNIEVYKTYVAENTTSILNWTNEVSKSASLSNLLKLQGANEWHVSGENHYAYFFTHAKLGILLSALIPIMAWSSLIWTRKKREIFFIGFASTLALLFIFFAGGTHPPLGKIYTWLIQNISYTNIYRTPFYKFSYGVVFSYAILIGFTLCQLKGFLEKKIFLKKNIKTHTGHFLAGLIIILSITALHSLYFHPNLFNLWETFALRVHLPNSIVEASDFMKNKPKDGRILLLPPLTHGFGGIDAYTWGYWSIMPLPSLVFSQENIADHDTLPPTVLVGLNNLYSALDTGNTRDVEKYLQLFDIQYILLRKDVAYQWHVGTTNPTIIEGNLLKHKNIFQEERTFGDWKIYEVKNPSPLIEVMNIPNLPSPNIEIEAKNSTQYSLQVTNARAPFQIFFKTTFHPYWKLYTVEASNSPIKNALTKIPFLGSWFLSQTEETNHFESYDFANTWRINPENPELNLRLEYFPQRLWFLGAFITILSLCLTVLFLIIRMFFHLRNKKSTETSFPK